MYTALAMNHTRRIVRKLNVALPKDDYELGELVRSTGEEVERQINSYDPLTAKTTTLPEESGNGTFFNYHAFGQAAQERVWEITKKRCVALVKRLNNA